MRKLIKNKKSQFFAWGMMIGVIALSVVIIILANNLQKNITYETSTFNELSDLNYKSDRIQLYFQESGKLALQQAIYQIILENFNQDCLINTDGYIIYSENCHPTKQDVLLILNSKTSEKLTQFLESKNLGIFEDIHCTFSDNDQETICNSKEISLKKEIRTSITTYNLTRKIVPKSNTTIKEIIELDELDSLYSQIKTKKDNCISNNDANLEECIKRRNQELNFFEIKEVHETNNYFFIEIQSKKSFFYQEFDKLEFKPFKFEFVIAK